MGGHNRTEAAGLGRWAGAGIIVAIWAVMMATATGAPNLPSSQAGDADSIKTGSVTLPWDDAKTLLKGIFSPDGDTRPPANYLIESAQWTGELREDHIELTAQCVISVLTATEWVKAPVASSKAIVKTALLNGQPAGLHEEDGLLHIVTNAPGRHTLTLTLVAAVSGSGQSGGSAVIPLAPFPQNALTLELPSPDYEFTIPQCAYVTVETNEDGKTAAARAVFGRTDQLQLRWQRKVTAGEGAKLPTKVTSRTFSLFNMGEGLMVISDRVNYTILNNPIESFKVEVSAASTVTSVEGPGVRGWRVEPPARETGEKAMLEVTFANETRGEGYFIINRDLPLRDDATSLALPMAHPLSVERNTGWVGVSAAANIECKVASQQKLTQTDVEETPALLSGLSADPLVLVFKYTDGPIALSLGLRRFDTLPVLTTIVDHADYTVLLTEDGKVLTRAVFQTRNNRNQYLQVALPEGAEIWSSFVAGEPVKPAMDDQGNLLLVLKKSFTVNEQTQAFPVEVIYLQELEDFESRGRLTLALARPDVPVSRAFATLMAPKDFKLRGFKGTLKKLDKPEAEYLPPARPLPQTAEAAVPQTPERRAGDMALQAVEMKALPQQAGGYSGTSPFASASPSTDEGNIYFNYGIGAQLKSSRGLLPIPIDIPSVGKPYYFGKILTTDEAFELAFTYRTKWLF